MSDDTVGNKLDLLEAYRKTFWPNPQGLHVLLALAESYQSIGASLEAIDLLQSAIRAFPHSPMPHDVLGGLYHDAGDTDKAALSYAQAAALDPYEQHFQIAYEYFDDLPDSPATLALLRTITQTNPMSFLHERLARCCWKLGEYGEAASVYRALLARKTLGLEERLDLEWQLSGLLIKMGNVAEGFSIIERILPQLGSSYDTEGIERDLADDYLKAGRFDSALKIFLHRAEHFLPGAEKAEMLRKAARCYHGQHHYDKAINCLIEILTFVRETGAPEDDFLAMKTVITDPRFYEDLYAALGQNYEAKGDVLRAREAFKKEKEYHFRASAPPTA